MNEVICVVLVDDHETIVFRHIERLGHRLIDGVTDRLLVGRRFAAPQIDAHKRHFYTNIITGFSISALKAPIN